MHPTPWTRKKTVCHTPPKIVTASEYAPTCASASAAKAAASRGEPAKPV